MDIVYRLAALEFEWNSDKAEINAQKHGIDFYDAAQVFSDSFCQYGDASDNDEVRDFVIGYSYTQRLLYVVHVERGERIRIISARVATKVERRFYEQS